jgi:hypothetical protein
MGISPNFPNNTCVFSIFEAPDSVTNLTIMADRFLDQINSLQSKEWRYVAFNGWLSGLVDYDSNQCN